MKSLMKETVVRNRAKSQPVFRRIGAF